jgi:putative transposase
MYRCVDAHRAVHGVESICKTLQVAPSGYWRHAARLKDPNKRCDRAKRDEVLSPHVQRVWDANRQVYGADKVYKQMNREAIEVARCTVERLMRRLHARWTA